MMRLSTTTVALTAAVLTAAVALPAAAATGSGNGGASPTPPPQQDSSQQDSSQQASAANYQPARATWYGPGFFGHRTACGTRLTHHTLGVAHKSLPCGTNVALRYRGRTVVVPVIDRGPYSRGVDYDLTEATARALGMSETSRLAAATLAD